VIVDRRVGEVRPVAGQEDAVLSCRDGDDLGIGRTDTEIRSVDDASDVVAAAAERLDSLTAGVRVGEQVHDSDVLGGEAVGLFVCRAVLDLDLAHLSGVAERVREGGVDGGDREFVAGGDRLGAVTTVDVPLVDVTDTDPGAFDPRVAAEDIRSLDDVWDAFCRGRLGVRPCHLGRTSPPPAVYSPGPRVGGSSHEGPRILAFDDHVTLTNAQQVLPPDKHSGHERARRGVARYRPGIPVDTPEVHVRPTCV
jgi:hypothetical protein